MAKLNRRAAYACEPLEHRRLLASFKLYVNNQFVSGPTIEDYPVAKLAEPGPIRTFAFENTDTRTYEVSAQINEFGAAGFSRSGQSGAVQLAPGTRYVVKWRLITTRAVARVGEMSFRYIEPDDGSVVKRTFTLRGNVLPAALTHDEDFGRLTEATERAEGDIVALDRVDGEGNTLEQINPYVATFELPAPSTRVDVTIRGESRFIPLSTTNFTSGVLELLLVRDINKDGKLNIEERE